MFSDQMKFFEQLPQNLKMNIKLVDLKKQIIKFNTCWGTENNSSTVLGDPGKNAGGDDRFALREVAVQDGPLCRKKKRLQFVIIKKCLSI